MRGGLASCCTRNSRPDIGSIFRRRNRDWIHNARKQPGSGKFISRSWTRMNAFSLNSLLCPALGRLLVGISTGPTIFPHPVGFILGCIGIWSSGGLRKSMAKPRQRKSKARMTIRLRHGSTVDIYLGRRWVAGWFVMDVTGTIVSAQTRGGDTARVPCRCVRPPR
jgi:hypothetical protein